MAKGAASKEIVFAKIKEMFPEAFMVDKEFRIPMLEGGEEVQIKVALTCAKTNVDHDGEAAVVTTDVPAELNFGTPAKAVKPHAEPTEEEKQNVKSLLERMGL